jgi:uncharacterized protein YwgA
VESSQIALKLFLDELGIPCDIDTLDDRKRVQKAVYLGQASGADLGYRFSWYLMGPYSPALTRDYYALAETIEFRKKEIEGRRLKKEVIEKLSSIKKILTPPTDISLTQESWLELLASYDYLKRVSRYSRQQALKVIRDQKTQLSPFVEKAEQALSDSGLN